MDKSYHYQTGRFSSDLIKVVTRDVPFTVDLPNQVSSGHTNG